MRKIPISDLNRQDKLINKEVMAKIKEVIASKKFIQGPYVSEFEGSFAKIHKTKYVIGCSSGTSALSVLLEALEIKKGDEVITTPYTFTATSEAICRLGAKPIFVDIDSHTYNIDPSKIDSAITKKTKAILPVHIYGNPTEMVKIMKIAKKNGLIVVEDCAQAHLASHNDIFVGNFGSGGTFSFYPGKNLGAYGDAGAIITNNSTLADKCRMLIDHGRKSKYLHELVGCNERMDGIQAGILSIKLKYLKDWTQKRQEIAKLYNKLLNLNKKLILPTVSENSEHVYHLYVVQVENRKKVINYLKEKGISIGIHYPTPLHLQPAYKYLGYKIEDFPVTEKVAEHVISLPMFPELKVKEIEYICKHLNFITK